MIRSARPAGETVLLPKTTMRTDGGKQITIIGGNEGLESFESLGMKMGNIPENPKVLKIPKDHKQPAAKP